MNRNSVVVLIAVVLACLAVAFGVIAVLSETGPKWAWVGLAVMAVAVCGALLRVGTLRDAR